jgi:hypothetical protein
MCTEYFIGDPASQMSHWILQTEIDNCAVAAEVSIINQFVGGDLCLDEATYHSAANGWYQPGIGTNPSDIGNMMDLHGISNHTVMGATIEQLTVELQNGHGVIVGVNSAELWDQGLLIQVKQFFLDAFGLDNINPADHAVVVTGVDVSDPNNPMVIINDSGTPNGAAVRYPLDQFVRAWENSGFYYTATEVPIPNSPYEPPSSLGFDVGSFLGLGTTLLTGSIIAGDLVYMVADEIDWDSVLQSI